MSEGLFKHIYQTVTQTLFAKREKHALGNTYRENPFVILWIFVLAGAIIAVCSKSSFLYPYNDWVDAHCYMTVARGILKGQMPYLDLIEQKGPLHYLLHVPATLIQSDGFFGVYLLEVAATGLFLWACYRILRLYGGEGVAVALPFLAALIYSSRPFAHGDSAEELALPFLAWGMYLSLRALKENRIPTPKECFCIGLLAAGVLWIKFTMLGLFLGMLPIPIVLGLRQKNAWGLAKGLAAAAGGVLLLTTPIVLWLGINGALDDCLKIYMYNNIFGYSDVSNHLTYDTVIQNLRNGMNHIRNTNKWLLFSMIFGFLGMWRFEKWTVCAHRIFMFLGMLFTVFIGGRYLGYYALAFGVFAVGGFVTLRQLYGKIPRIPRFLRYLKAPAVAAACVIAVLHANTYSPNAYLREYTKEQMPPFIFAERIKANEEKTLINYGFLDGGFYMAAGAEPVCRYFCTLNTLVEEAMKEQNAAIAERRAKFIVTRSYKPHFEGYQVVDNASLYFEGHDFDYYLYERID